MKRLTYLIIALLCINAVIVAQANTTGDSANIETRILQAFESLQISRGINVTLVEADEPKAEIYIQNASPDEVIIEQEGSKLNIRMKSRSYPDSVAVNVFLHYQIINKISVLSGGSVYNKWELETEELMIESGANAKLELEILVAKLTINAASSEIELNGEAKAFDLNATSGTKVEAGGLEVEDATIRANTGSKVQLLVNNSLYARIGTGALVQYAGNPAKVESSVTLGGKLEALNE